MDARWNYLQETETPQVSIMERFRHYGNLLRDAVRFRRPPPRPPDWEFDQTVKEQAENKDAKPKEEDDLDKRWDRHLIIDTSTISHYRVSFC